MIEKEHKVISLYMVLKCWLVLWLVLQGISITGWSWDLLWCSIWKEHSLGYRISIWIRQRSTVCWKHFESFGMSFMGSVPVYSPLVPWLCVHDLCWIQWRSYYSCQTTQLNFIFTNFIQMKVIKLIKYQLFAAYSVIF